MCLRNSRVTPATVYICPKNTEPHALASFYPRRSCIARVASCMILAVLDRRATGVATSVGLGSPVSLFSSLPGPASRLSLLSTPPHLISPLLTSPHLTSPHLTSPHLTSPHFTSPHFTSPHFTSPHFTSPHLTSPHLTSPHLTSPHLTSPHRVLAAERRNTTSSLSHRHSRSRNTRIEPTSRNLRPGTATCVTTIASI
jgi:hypothetical protein